MYDTNIFCMINIFCIMDNSQRVHCQSYIQQYGNFLHAAFRELLAWPGIVCEVFITKVDLGASLSIIASVLEVTVCTTKFVEFV